MNDIGWVNGIFSNPIGYVFAKSAAIFCVVTDFVCLAQVFQSVFCPITYRDFYSVLWCMLNFFPLLNCKSLSQASRKRLDHLPGKQFFLCQINSSVQSQPCFRISRMRSITYVLRSPSTTFSFYFQNKRSCGFQHAQKLF